MLSYRVTWEIDLYAKDAHDAAIQARRIQLDINSSATVFDVTSETGEASSHDLTNAEMEGQIEPC